MFRQLAFATFFLTAGLLFFAGPPAARAQQQQRTAAAGGARPHDHSRHHHDGRFSRDVWQAEAGLQQNSVQALWQTRDGYLWIGNQEGLARFDGVRFTIYDRANTPSLCEKNVRVLHQDRRGTLWIGTNAGLSSYRAGEFTPCVADAATRARIESFAEDVAGTLWVGSHEGVFRLQTDESGAATVIDRLGTDRGLPSKIVQAIYFDRRGTLWAGTDAGLSRFDGEKFVPVDAGADLAGAIVNTIRDTAADGLLVGTDRGLFSLRKGDADPARMSATRHNAAANGAGARNAFVNQILEDRRGALWVGANDELYQFVGGELVPQWLTDDESTSNVLSLFEDAEGSLWIGTDNAGLHRFKINKFSYYGARQGLADDMAWNVREDREGTMWFGTSNGLSRMRDGKFTTVTIGDGLTHKRVSAIFEDADGTMWFGTVRGLNHYVDGKFTTYTKADGLAGDSVRSIHRDRRGALWIGTRTGLSRFENDSFQNYTTRDGLPDDSVWAIHEDRAGTMWFGTQRGLCSLGRDGRFAAHGAGTPQGNTWAIHEDAQGTLWFGTESNGLYRLRDGKFTNFTTAQGLFDDLIYRILEDDRGNLWMSCNKGVFRVNKTDLERVANNSRASFASVAYDASDGMPNRECNGGTVSPAGWRSRDGRLWFPTLKGVTVVDPNVLHTNELPPPVVIERIVADGRPLAYRGGDQQAPQIAAGTDKLEFEYTALSLFAPGKVRFEFQLEGFDEEWVDAGTRRAAFYTNLAPGVYTLRVVAANNDGVWNHTGAEMKFELLPRLHQTLWFRLLCGVALIVLAALVVRWRGKQIGARERQRHEESLRSLIENASDMILILDGEGRMRYRSPSVERSFGRAAGGDSSDASLYAYVHTDDRERVAEVLCRAMRQHDATQTFEFRSLHRDGSWRVQEAVGKSVPDRRTGESVIVVNARDVTDRKQIEERLVHGALHDALTGLANRALVMDRLRAAVERARLDPSHKFGLLFIDLDRFKIINDSLGHAVGDELLIAISRRLQAAIRPGDTLARLGGDEFVILLGHIDDEERARGVAARIHKIFAQVFDLSGHQVFASASIGIRVWDAADSGGADDLLRDADTAMYRAKSLGKDRHETFDPAMREEVVTTQRLETELRRAVERDEFVVHYQPIVALGAGGETVGAADISGFEALVRWQHPERGLLAPGEFLSLAEETGLIVPIGWFVLREACRRIVEWEGAAPVSPAAAPRTMSVNLSSQQLRQPDLVERVMFALEDTGCDPRRLKLEITESAMIDDAEATLDKMRRIRTLGVELSIDDFGTGYSSLSYIHRFPVTTLKLDRSFVSRIGDRAEDAEVVRTIVMFARNLGMDMVAEGIETVEQLAHLRALRCEYGQGYKFYRPMDGDRVGELLRAANVEELTYSEG